MSSSTHTSAISTTSTTDTIPKRQSWWHWRPTSQTQVEQVEKALLSEMGVEYEQRQVGIEGGSHINTVICGSGPPLVLLHGFAAGIGMWHHILGPLSTYNTVYAIDLPGFGRSGRKAFKGSKAEDAENYFLHQLESWRKSVGLDTFAIMGHSFGAYLAGSYALQYSQNVTMVILADPWGVPQKVVDPEKKAAPLKWRVAAWIGTTFNPLAVIRVAGPWGPDLVTKFRPDIARKFVGSVENTDAILHYIYQVNAAAPTGETAFSSLTEGIGWACRPLGVRLAKLEKTIPVAWMYGSSTWTDSSAGHEFSERMQPRSSYYIISGAGHHCYADNSEEFLAACNDAISRWGNYKANATFSTPSVPDPAKSAQSAEN